MKKTSKNSKKEENTKKESSGKKASKKEEKKKTSSKKSTGKKKTKKTTSKKNESKKSTVKKTQPKKKESKRKSSGKKTGRKKKQDSFFAKHKKILQLLALLLALSFFLVIGKYYLIDLSKKQALRIQTAQNEYASDGILEAEEYEKGQLGRPEIKQDFLTVNPYSRPGIAIGKVKGIVIHYVANPGSSARENRSYFEGLKDNHVTKASSHYIVDLDGEILQCIPLGEISYASNNRNTDTISIECCHPGSDGAFTEETRQSLIKLVSWLCDTYGLSEKNVIRHYDVTGKACPLYYVEHEDAWEAFLQEIKNTLP